MDHDPLSPTVSHEPEIPENRRYMLASLSCLGVVLCVAFAATMVLAFYFLRPSFVALLSATPRPTFTNTPAPAAQIAPASTQATASQKPDVEISLYCALMGDSPSYAEVDQPVILTWAWGAATEAYGQDYIDAASFSVQIDGENVDVSSVAPVLSIESNEYWATWSLPPRTFSAGTHQTILNVTLSRQITDGLDLDLDGNLDLYGPGLSTFAPCDIIVTQARATEPSPIHDTDLPQAQWPLVLFDSFDTNRNSWPVFSDNTGSGTATVGVREGKYVWSVQSDPGSLGVGWPFWADRSHEASDFYASVEANVTGEIKDATCGLMFRYSDTGFYAFGLNDQGLFTVEAIVYNQSNKILIKPTETSAVQSGEANRLSVVAVGSHLMFYINGQLVAELDDDTLQRGFVGVYINLEGGNALADVEFDNFELHESGPPSAVVTSAPPTTAITTNWQIVATDTFDSNLYQWDDRDSSYGSFTFNAHITGGKYVIELKSGDTGSSSSKPAYGITPVSDFQLAVDAKQVSGAENAAYGVIFRSDLGPERYYAFIINGKGQYAVYLSGVRVLNVLISWTDSSAIKPGEVNHLSVTGTGSHFALYINDNLVYEFDDEELKKGYVGITVGLEQADDEATVEFDNLELRAP